MVASAFASHAPNTFSASSRPTPVVLENSCAVVFGARLSSRRTLTRVVLAAPRESLSDFVSSM